MNRFVSIAAALVVLAGGVFAWQYTSRGADSGFVGIAEAQSADGEAVDTSMVTEMDLGDPEAAVTVIEYASFTCPHCRDFHENTFKEFKANYIDTGKVHFIYREVYFDRFGLWAGMVARCGGEERYFGIADMIYDEQRTWTRAESEGEIAENLMKIGRKAGLTTEELDACLKDGDMARAMVAVYQENAERDSIRSTPSFMINGDLVTGNQDYSAFSALIDEALGS
jgi:protein-disulfide isomerase